MATSLDFLSSVLDEVSLEGLDGITLETLWQRLKDRPGFCIAVDDDSKNFLWKNLAKLKDIEMYQLPKPREFVPIYDRYKNMDPEHGVVCENAFKVQDPYYPIVPIIDVEVRGSCATYKTRKCITSNIRYGNEVLVMPLSQVVDEYGDSMVLVASPKARLLALIGSETNPLIDLSLEEYCLLERIGRSRYLGEVTQGENGLLSLKATFCKHLHYYRKKLTIKQLIKKQNHCMKTRKGATASGSLFHLTRFYVLRKTKMACLLQSVCDILKDKPQNREACTEIRNQLGSKKGSFKNLYTKHFQKWLKASTITCKELYPNGTQKDWYTVAGQEKVVKVMQLVRHCDEEDDDVEEEADDRDQTVPLNVHFDYSKVAYGVPLLYQIYGLIRLAGPEGISSTDLGRKMTLPKLEIRNLVRTLDREGHICSIPRSRGRQTFYMHISIEYRDKSETYSNLKEQEKKLIRDEKSSNALVKRKFDCKENIQDASKAKKIKLGKDEEKIILNYHKIQLENTKSENILAEKLNNFKCEVYEVNSKSISTESSKNCTENSIASMIFSSSKKITYRKIKRCNIIMDLLKKDCILSTSDLQKYILQKEREEGYDFKLDKRSTARLVDSLIKNDKLKKIVVQLEAEEKQTKMEFICEKYFEKSDPRLLLAIEQARFRFFTTLKSKNNKLSSEQKMDIINNSETTILVANNLRIPKLEITEIESFQAYPHMSPKFVRVKALHLFLNYLAYQNKNVAVTSDERVVYHNSISWKRFVHPIPDYGHHGWFLISDIYSRMPLSLFFQLVNFKKELPTLKGYLKNEERANYLIKFLPQSLHENLLTNHKYRLSIVSSIRVLCYMGLVSIGPEVGKHKDHSFLYVHKKATLKNTTTSSPGYIHVNSNIDYDVKSYVFESEGDVLEYWQELENICFHTPLGKYSTAIGKTLEIVEPAIKSELMSCTRNVCFDEVSDVGLVPGDGLGAAGFDSSLFLHIRRNWKTSASILKKSLKDANESKSSECPIQHLLKLPLVTKPATRCRLQKLTERSLLLKKERKLKIEKHSQITEVKHESKITTEIGLAAAMETEIDEEKPYDFTGIKSKTENTKVFVIEKERQQSIENSIVTKGFPGVSKFLHSTTKYQRKRGIKLITVKQRPLTRTPFYDKKDKIAMGKLGKSRCQWSPQEDSFLLLCKVASCFLQPTAYSRTIVVHYSIVRDLLHENVPDVSADKTSRACQRRMRYMMANTTTVNSVKVFLREALRDDELVKEFDKPKPPKTKLEEWKSIFTRIIYLLRHKFTLHSMDRCTNVSISRTVQEFNEKFEILKENDLFRHKEVYNDPESIGDIQKVVLIFLILAAMAVENEEKWTPVLNNLYQTYPESVLQSAVAHLRKELVISVKRKAHRSDMQSLRNSNSPYKFSITYHNAKIAKFPQQIFKDAGVFLNSLKSLDSKSNLEVKGDVPAGHIASVLSLLATERLQTDIQVPDQIILLDSTLSKKVRTDIVDRMCSTLSCAESVELLQYLKNDKNFLVEGKYSTHAHLKLPNDGPSSNTLQCSNLSTTDIELQASEVQRFSKASRFALYLLRHELSQQTFEKEQHSQDYIVLNACRIFCRLSSSPSSMLLTNTPDLIEEIHHRSQSTDTEQCAQLKNNHIEEISNLLTCYIPADSFVVHSNYVDTILVLYQRYQTQTVADAKCLFSNLYKAGPKGISEIELWRKFTELSGELSFFQHLHILREAFLILRVGVTGFSYVSTCFAKCWVLPSLHILSKPANTRVKDIDNQCPNYLLSTHSEDKKFRRQASNDQELTKVKNSSQTVLVYFIPRTWRNPDGSLNKPVLFDLLFVLLSYLISCPGASTSQIYEHFVLVLPPVQILELLEVLEKSGCIYKYYCKSIGKVTLFSPPPKTFIAVDPKPGDLDHIEVFPDAVCKIMELMNVMI